MKFNCYFLKSAQLSNSLLPLFLSILVSFSMNSSFANTFNCGTDKMNKVVPSMLDVGDSHSRFLQSSGYQTLRIEFDYTDLENNKDISSTYLANVKQVMNSINSSLEGLLTIQRLTALLKVTDCDGINFTIPDRISSEGVSKDLLIFVISADSSTQENVEAYAYTCKVDSITGRPIVGVVAINTAVVSFSKQNALEYHYLLLIHEITHVLVFNEVLYEYFWNPETQKKVPYSDTVQENVMINGVSRNLIKSPKVLEVAKKYFNCSTMQGVELEAQGGSGSAGSHWESRTMLGEYMIAQSYGEVFISEITLALFEDSGWYKVNYYTGGLFKYGYLAGCSFLNEKCVINQITQNTDYMCSSSDGDRCLAGKKYRGYCSLSTYNSIPSAYQYYSNSKTGSSFYFADYCPVIIGYELESDMYFSGSCLDGYSNLQSFYNEEIGTSSGCFESSLLESLNTQINQSVFCYKYECNVKNTSVIVNLGSNQYECPGNGGKLKLQGFSGYIVCPEYNKYCTSTVTCSSSLDCITKKSMRNSPVDTYVKIDNTQYLNTDTKVSAKTGTDISNSETTISSETITDSNSNTIGFYHLSINFVILISCIILI